MENQAIKSLMFEVSNNSRITQQVIQLVSDKLDAKEQRDFLEWLKIVRTETQIKVNKAKRSFGFHR
jgi:hypothetical protein